MTFHECDVSILASVSGILAVVLRLRNLGICNCTTAAFWRWPSLLLNLRENLRPKGAAHLESQFRG